MKNNIYLPTLKRVRIINYSLYNDDIDFKFINGINLIIGGNGVGKTTFINIVKYALIGLYKKDLTVRNYDNKKRFIRGSYTNCNTYFRNRTKEEPSDREGFVELSFNIKDIEFTVKRSLYDTELTFASYVKDGRLNVIEGERIRQDLYSKYENSPVEEKKKYLQFNYESIVAKEANLSDFNDFIFFVNQILLFSESRDNVLWSEDAQNRLLSNYLNDPDLEKKRKDFNFESKYQDSIARHRQEEIKAIRKVVDKLDDEKGSKKSKNDKLVLLDKIEVSEHNVERIRLSRYDLQRKVKVLYKTVSELSSSINEKEKVKEKIENENNKQYWIGVNPKYRIYKKQIISNNICPMCNSPLNRESIVDDAGKCFFCHTSIAPTQEDSSEIEKLKLEISNLAEERKNKELLIYNQEKELKKLDTEFRTAKYELFELKNKLRDIEDSTNYSDPKNESAYIAMLKRIDELSAEKDKASILSERYRDEGSKIVRSIEENLLESTKSISSIFNDFAEAFLRVPCYLTFDALDKDKVKRFIPVIDGKVRFEPEELSESQRFFIDYSFRMSILSFFYNYPTFYICETPDSSLDISYEENAAITLIKYIEQPNSLILTSNLNNSTFIKSLLSKTSEVKVLNLLKYGKTSIVQIEHLALQALSKEIEEFMYE
jgi:energy-coupling factor transporter ATP-binding protein EcfA2